ncbi:MAG TPA: glycosyltransferase [Solirubrobacterales bacterium]|nr:glycosyltransferase [Solirubrobacterales bacterium]
MESRLGQTASLSIVIPAYNEEVRLPALLEKLRAEAEKAAVDAGLRLHEVLVVDDGSTDRTRELLEAAADENGRLQGVFAYDRNRGKGAAFAAGAERATGEWVLLADVDLSTPLDELGKLTAAVEAGADVAIGSRAVAGAVVERGPLHRKVTGSSFNAAVRLLTGLRVRDTQNGFKLFPTEALKRYVAQQTCPGFAFDVELLMRADRDGLRIVEVPILYTHDLRSSVNVASASSRMLREIARLAYRLRVRKDSGAADSADIVRAA